MNKILVVDDDPDLLVAMKAALLRQGYEVAVTLSCEEGLAIFHSFKPGLIFLDINVGTQDGREMCKRIKAQAEYKHIIVILMSANNEALQLYKDYSADAMLRKPFSHLSLSETLKNFIEKI